MTPVRALNVFNINLLLIKLEPNFWRKCVQSVVEVTKKVRLGSNGKIASVPLAKPIFIFYQPGN